MRFEVPAFLIIGFVLDLIFGDPKAILHPVVIIGRLISFLEVGIRAIFPKNKGGEFIGGIVLSAAVILLAFFIPMGVLVLAGKVSPWFRFLLECFWCWQILAIKSLSKEALMVNEKVSNNDLDGARKQVSRIVGRDTANLSMEEVIKACVETVSESTSDGIIAPLFFMAIGGVPFGFLYKAANTLDSMVGYRSEKYEYLGKASARIDDLLNLIPSRLTALCMIGVSPMNKLDGKNAFYIWRRDGKKHLSPNSGNPEAACAGALGVQLGGDAYYFGKRYEKQTLGDANRKVEGEDINRAVRLMFSSSLLFLLVVVAIRLLAETAFPAFPAA